MFKTYNIANLPPDTDKEAVGKFGQLLFEDAQREKERQGLPHKWTHAYAMYRGDHWQKGAAFRKKSKSKVTVNLFFTNVIRTVSNITARRPVAEVVDLESGEDNADMALTARNRKWWKETKQQVKLKETALKMEKYGITVEHPVWMGKKNDCDIVVMDCFACFPAPGNWKNFDEDCPYFCKAFAENCDVLEKRYGLDPGTIKPDEVYSSMGEARSETRPVPTDTYPGSVAAAGNYTDPNMHPVVDGSTYLQKRALVVELWVRDPYTKTTTSENVVGEDLEGNPVIEKTTKKKYPDDIRRILFTNQGQLVLEDTPNPNINWALPMDRVKETHAWGRFPFYKVNSYLDTTSPWGFSALDQVGDLNKKVDEIMSRLLAWVMRVMFPPLIVAKETGLTKAMINSDPNRVYMVEKVAHVNGIRFEPVPNLPSNFIEILNLVLTFFDRIYQIEDADRGVGPRGVVAASAIVALQERNAVLIQEKIIAVDGLVENRGKWKISMDQNFGFIKEPIEVDGDRMDFRGTDLVGRKFNFVVESGSTMPRTSLQVEEQAKDLYDKGAIDRQALLEALNFPNWKKIIERAGEGQVDQALQILIAAGLDEETAYALKQYVMQPDQGPGGSKEKSGVESVGKPKGIQGKTPPAGVRQNPAVGKGV